MVLQPGCSFPCFLELLDTSNTKKFEYDSFLLECAIKMGGFELEILLETYVCSETGKPYIRKYHDTSINDECDEYEKIYDLPVVPEKYRPYLSMCGKHFYYYIEKTCENPYRGSAHVSSVLHSFPAWETIVYHTKYFPVTDWWTEEKHTEFKEFLGWCLDQGAAYSVRWERD